MAILSVFFPIFDHSALPEDEISVCGRKRAEHVEFGGAAGSEIHLTQIECVVKDVTIHFAPSSCRVIGGNGKRFQEGKESLVAIIPMKTLIKPAREQARAGNTMRLAG